MFRRKSNCFYNCRNCLMCRPTSVQHEENGDWNCGDRNYVKKTMLFLV